MPRPRFARLDEDKRAEILNAAEREFAAHGFYDASFNRIIAASGTSKGAMYYYFDDKEDLFATVIERALGGLGDAIGELGPTSSVDEFWDEVDRLVGRAADWFAASPARGRLARSVAGANGNLPGLSRMFDAAREITQDVVTRGVEVGAVRSNVPADLLVSWLLSLGEASDVYLSQLDDLEPAAVAELTTTTMDAMRRLCAPDPH